MCIRDSKSSAAKQSKPIKGRRLNSETSETSDTSETSNEEWVIYASTSEAARQLGLHSGAISQCVNGKIKKTGGYEFVRDTEAAEPEVLPGEKWLDVVAEEYRARVQKKNTKIFSGQLGKGVKEWIVTRSCNPRRVLQ